MKKSDVYEEIITKDDIQPKEENIIRVDKRPASIYSIIVFAVVFLICYLFYPQLSMMIPVSGEKLTVNMGYRGSAVTEMLDAEMIVVAVAGEKGDKKSYVAEDGTPIVFTSIEFDTVEVIKGTDIKEFTLKQYGGNALFKDGSGRQKKFTVTYPDAAEFEKGKTYLLFITPSGDTVNGRAGAIVMNDEGRFVDVYGVAYTISDVRALFQEDAK